MRIESEVDQTDVNACIRFLAYSALKLATAADGELGKQFAITNLLAAAAAVELTEFGPDLATFSKHAKQVYKNVKNNLESGEQCQD